MVYEVPPSACLFACVGWTILKSSIRAVCVTRSFQNFTPFRTGSIDHLSTVLHSSFLAQDKTCCVKISPLAVALVIFHILRRLDLYVGAALGMSCTFSSIRGKEPRQKAFLSDFDR